MNIYIYILFLAIVFRLSAVGQTSLHCNFGTSTTQLFNYLQSPTSCDRGSFYLLTAPMHKNMHAANTNTHTHHLQETHAIIP